MGENLCMWRAIDLYANAFDFIRPECWHTEALRCDFDINCPLKLICWVVSIIFMDVKDVLTNITRVSCLYGHRNT